MNLRSQAKSTLSEVSATSKRVVETTSWATVAMIAVATVSVVALAIAIAALVSKD